MSIQANGTGSYSGCFDSVSWIFLRKTLSEEPTLLNMFLKKMRTGLEDYMGDIYKKRREIFQRGFFLIKTEVPSLTFSSSPSSHPSGKNVKEKKILCTTPLSYESV